MLKNSSKNSFQLRIIHSKSRGCARKADNLHKNQTIRKRIRRLYFIFFERKIDMQYHNIVDGDNTIPMGIVVGVDVLSDPFADRRNGEKMYKERRNVKWQLNLK